MKVYLFKVEDNIQFTHLQHNTDKKKTNKQEDCNIIINIKYIYGSTKKCLNVLTSTKVQKLY